MKQNNRPAELLGSIQAQGGELDENEEMELAQLLGDIYTDQVAIDVMELDEYLKSKVRFHLGYNSGAQMPAGDRARLEEAMSLGA